MRKKLQFRPRVWLGVLALAVGVAIGATGIAYAAIPDPDGVIHGCVGKGNGAMRVIDPSTGASCTSQETALNFSQRGPAGVSGYEIVRAAGTASTANFQVQVATCPTGKKVVSGGGFPVFDTGVSGVVDLVAIHASVPISLSNSDDTWDVQAIETQPDNFSTWHLVVWAVCAMVGP